MHRLCSGRVRVIILKFFCGQVNDQKMYVVNVEGNLKLYVYLLCTKQVEFFELNDILFRHDYFS